MSELSYAKVPAYQFAKVVNNAGEGFILWCRLYSAACAGLFTHYAISKKTFCLDTRNGNNSIVALC